MIYNQFHPLFPLDQVSLHYFSVLRRALFTAQHLEMNCRTIVAFLYIREQRVVSGKSVLENPVFRRNMDKLWRKTLGRHINKLTDLKIFSDDALSTFNAAVAARNEIAHCVAMDVSERLDTKIVGRVDHTLRLVRSIAEAILSASAMLHFLNKDPLPGGLSSYEDHVVAWASENILEK